LTFVHIEQAIAAVARGDLILVLDDESREDEGDLIFAAEAATPEKVAFLVRHTGGIIRAALTTDRLAALHLPLLPADESDPQRAAFTVPVDVRHGITTGISAHDRALTLHALSSPSAVAGDFIRPGHVFPLQAQEGGVLTRPGHTEAAVDFARLSGLRPAGVLSEVVDAEGAVMRRAGLLRFAREHRMPIATIADLMAYRRRHERWLVPTSESAMPTRFGTFKARVYRSSLDGIEHVVLFMGNLAGNDDVPVRVHSECLTSEAFGSLRCDCRDQLEAALAAIAKGGTGALIYLRGHEGRGIGLSGKVSAYALQDRGQDTVQANLSLGYPVDARNYEAAAVILRDLGPHSIRLMSNNPEKFAALTDFGIPITRRVRLTTQVHEHNRAYMRAKHERLGHDLAIDAPAVPLRSLGGG
jgi:3,4-dihydroxy 2-butanone 4-phosphate synthase/GTP cyclohydrolase II